MIDKTVPEAIRFKSADFSVTKELRCPVCGGKVSYRSWDAEHEAFCYHCTYCGHDTKITWEAAAVLRAKGEVKFDENGDPIIPEDVEVPSLPADPDNSAYEIWEIMQTAQAASGEEQGQPAVTTKHTITITGTGCKINNETASNKAVEVDDNASYAFKVTATGSTEIVADSDVDFTKVTVTIDGVNLTSSNKTSLGVTWVVGTNDVTFTVGNVKANRTITVAVSE